MSTASPSVSVPRRAPVVSGYPLLGLALGMTALAYLATIHFHFVYDDSPQIIQNPTLTSWRFLPTFFKVSNWHFLVPNWAGNYYRPVFMCWLLVNRMLWGLNPVLWHASALALHLLATWLAFAVARRIFHNEVQAGFAALIFGLHPIHIESVAWISGATDPLMTVFVFAAFWAWLRGEESERSLWRTLSAVLYLLACLSKETALLLPLVIAAYFYFVRGQKGLRSVVATWLMYLAAAFYLAARAIALHGLVHSMGVPLKWAALSVPVVLWGYLRRLVWPFSLSLFYDTPPVIGILQWRFWLPLLALVAIPFLAFRCRKRWPVVVFALVWIFVFMAPAILGLAIFPTGEWIHDRYLYLPSFGLCLCLGNAFAKLRSEREFFGLPAKSTAASLILAAVLSFATVWQEQYWANSLLLYMHAVNAAPQNVWAKYYLAGELLRRGDKMNARRLYEAALAIEPTNWKNNVAYGLMLYDQADYRAADTYITRALEGDSSDANAHFDQGMSRMNYGNFAGAEISFREALRRNRTLLQAHFWLGTCLERQGKLDAARSEYQAEAHLHPDTASNAKQRLRELTPR